MYEGAEDSDDYGRLDKIGGIAMTEGQSEVRVSRVRIKIVDRTAYRIYNTSLPDDPNRPTPEQIRAEYIRKGLIRER